MAAKRRSKRTANGDPERNKAGQFKRGNRAAVGHGRPKNTAREAIQKALGGDQGLTDLVDTLKTQADSGDVQAARMLIEMGWGKAREQDASVALPVPQITNAAELQSALLALAESVANGSVGPDMARQMSQVFMAAKSTEVEPDDDSESSAYL